MTATVPFDYIESSALQSIITCMLSKRYESLHLKMSLGQYLQRESDAALNTGYLEVDALEWSNCSTFQLLDQFAQMKLLQVKKSGIQGQPRKIIIPTKLPRNVTIMPARIGESIRNFMLREGEVYPYQFWLLWKRVRRSSSYKAVAQYFHTLEKIGLIEKVKKKPYVLFNEVYRGQKARVLYRITPGKEGDPTFRHADVELYPSHRFGARRYKKAKSQGRVIPGRSQEYG